MDEQHSASPVGVIGAGSFGIAIANLLARNADVLIFSRNPEVAREINARPEHQTTVLSPRIRATTDLDELARRCTLLFPIVPSTSFRRMIQTLAPHLRPYHIVIHETRGRERA